LTTSHGRLKAGYYALTAFSSLATQYYFNYLFFFLRDRFAFGSRGNLAVAALHGGIYVVASWQCGKFAERYGLHTSLKLGFAGLIGCMAIGAIAPWAPAQLAVVAGFTVAVCFVWPAIEALVTHDEPAARVPHTVGVYNTTWSSASALAYFTGGTLYDAFGRGAIFLLPGVVFAGALAATWHLERRAAAVAALSTAPPPDVGAHPDPRAYTQPVPPATFLKLAWIANPFAYVAIYTLLATMPAIASRFALSPAEAGLVGSVWFFARLGAFVGLWHWTGWHYRFRWLGGGYAALAVSFVAILLAPALWVVVAAEVAFGVAAGLMYYSSLFYSMDVGEARAEHGGLHEAAIGAGIFLGPAIGAVSLHFFPTHAHAGSIAVSAVLFAGLGMLVTTWTRARKKKGPGS
jgi:predicted MFS family arabinose efflux permease